METTYVIFLVVITMMLAGILLVLLWDALRARNGNGGCSRQFSSIEEALERLTIQVERLASVMGTVQAETHEMLEMHKVTDDEGRPVWYVGNLRKMLEELLSLARKMGKHVGAFHVSGDAHISGDAIGGDKL